MSFNTSGKRKNSFDFEGKDSFKKQTTGKSIEDNTSTPNQKNAVSFSSLYVNMASPVGLHPLETETKSPVRRTLKGGIENLLTFMLDLEEKRYCLERMRIKIDEDRLALERKSNAHIYEMIRELMKTIRENVEPGESDDGGEMN